MSTPKQPDLPPKGQFLVYQTEDGQVKIDVRLQGETAWLTQAHMAALFQTTVPNVNMHLRNIFAEGELQARSVIQEFLITAATTQTEEGREEVKRGGDSEDMNATPLFVSFPNPNGIASISPGLRGTSYPGLMERGASTPTGLCQAGRATEPNPFRVDDVCFTISYMMESLWDSPTGARQARDLEQTIAGSLALPSPLLLGEAGVRVRRLGQDRGEGAQRVAEILEA